MNHSKINYEFLYLFRDIMRCGSIQKAAKELGCSQGVLNKKIAQAEENLGFNLFHPDSNGMVPTAAGLYLYDQSDTILWNVDAMLQQAKNIPKEMDMSLNLGISDMIACKLYQPIIQNFAKSHGDVNLVLSAPPTPDMRRKLIDGRIDAVLTYSVGFVDEPRLLRKEVYRGKPFLYYHKDMSLEEGELSILSFRNCPFICLNTEVAARNMLRELPFEPVRVIFAENLRTLWLYVNAGLACTVLGPQHMHAGSDVLGFELTDVDYTMGVDLVWEKSNNNPAIGLFANAIDKILALKDAD